MQNKRISEAVLEKVNGGGNGQKGIDPQAACRKKSDCPVCQRETWFECFSGTQAFCEDCGYEKAL